MIALSDFKKLLGTAALDLTDAEIENIRAEQYQFADAVFERWLRKRNAKAQEGVETTADRRYNKEE